MSTELCQEVRLLSCSFLQGDQGQCEERRGRDLRTDKDLESSGANLYTTITTRTTRTFTLLWSAD